MSRAGECIQGQCMSTLRNSLLLDRLSKNDRPHCFLFAISRLPLRLYFPLRYWMPTAAANLPAALLQYFPATVWSGQVNTVPPPIPYLLYCTTVVKFVLYPSCKGGTAQVKNQKSLPRAKFSAGAVFRVRGIYYIFSTLNTAPLYIFYCTGNFRNITTVYIR